MYAVIASGGKQYKVTHGGLVRLEVLSTAVGCDVLFDQVLLISDPDAGLVKVGMPYVVGAQITGKVIEEDRADKVSIIKFRRRKHFMKRAGHRQNFVVVKIIDIKY